MIELLQVSFAFPTVIFTLLLGLVVVYWALVILGALDLDMLDSASGATDGIDTASEAFVTTTEADGADGVLDGSLPAIVTELGLRGVPLTVWLSIYVLIAWAVTLLGMRFVGGAATTLLGSFGAGALVTTIALVVAAVGTATLTRPMRRFFESPTAQTHKSLVGKVCTVTTLRVDGDFGQAEVEDGGAGLLVQVRCDDANDLTRGSRALIFDYDPEQGIFHVSRFDDPVDVNVAARRLRTPN
jgi:hypothetical protein